MKVLTSETGVVLTLPIVMRGEVVRRLVRTDDLSQFESHGVLTDTSDPMDVVVEKMTMGYRGTPEQLQLAKKAVSDLLTAINDPSFPKQILGTDAVNPKVVLTSTVGRVYAKLFHEKKQKAVVAASRPAKPAKPAKVAKQKKERVAVKPKPEKKVKVAPAVKVVKRGTRKPKAQPKPQTKLLEAKAKKSTTAKATKAKKTAVRALTRAEKKGTATPTKGTKQYSVKVKRGRKPKVGTSPHAEAVGKKLVAQIGVKKTLEHATKKYKKYAKTVKAVKNG